MSEPMLSVYYLYEPDEVWTFPVEGKRITFGRDDDCDITIFSAINGNALSRVAGRIWRMEDELWLRNLSESHELRVEVPGRPQSQPLQPRRGGTNDHGPAQSIPGELAYIVGPDDCVLVVTQHRPPPVLPASGGGRTTFTMPNLPAKLRPVAVALCEPLLRGGALPASYSEMSERLGVSYKGARKSVAQLIELYLEAIPELRSRVDARMRIEEEKLGLPPAPAKIRGGVWIFDPVPEDGASETADLQRRRALALPDYYELAHLLVRRYVVTLDDLT
jgi:hypothetical protein